MNGDFNWKDDYIHLAGKLVSRRRRTAEAFYGDNTNNPAIKAAVSQSPCPGLSGVAALVFVASMMGGVAQSDFTWKEGALAKARILYSRAAAELGNGYGSLDQARVNVSQARECISNIKSDMDLERKCHAELISKADGIGGDCYSEASLVYDLSNTVELVENQLKISTDRFHLLAKRLPVIQAGLRNAQIRLSHLNPVLQDRYSREVLHFTGKLPAALAGIERSRSQIEVLGLAIVRQTDAQRIQKCRLASLEITFSGTMRDLLELRKRNAETAEVLHDVGNSLGPAQSQIETGGVILGETGRSLRAAETALNETASRLHEPVRRRPRIFFGVGLYLLDEEIQPPFIMENVRVSIKHFPMRRIGVTLPAFTTDLPDSLTRIAGAITAAEILTDDVSGLADDCDGVQRDIISAADGINGLSESIKATTTETQKVLGAARSVAHDTDILRRRAGSNLKKADRCIREARAQCANIATTIGKVMKANTLIIEIIPLAGTVAAHEGILAP